MEIDDGQSAAPNTKIISTGNDEKILERAFKKKQGSFSKCP